MGNLLSIKYWFNIYPGLITSAGIKVFLSLLVTVLVFSVVFKILIITTKEKLHRRLFRKLFSFSVTNFIIVSLLFFLMFETVPFLSSRFWMLVLLVIDLVWLYFILRFFKTIPSQKDEREREKEYSKYLP